jgi:hypothetical protein
MGFHLGFIRPDHLEGDDLHPFPLQAAQDFSGYPALENAGLQHDKSSFHGYTLIQDQKRR